MDAFSNKIQIDHFDSDHHTAHDDHFGNTQDNDQKHCDDMDNFDHETYNKLDKSQQIDGIKPDTRFCQENKNLRSVKLSMSTNVSTIMPIRVSIIHTYLQSLFIQHLYKSVNIVLSLQLSIPVSLQDDILRHLCRDISTTMSLQSSLLASLRSGFLQSSLLASLRNGFLQRSLLMSLRSWILQPSLLTSLRNICLQCLYGCIYTVLSIQAKSETPTFKVLLRKSIPISLLHLYKHYGYNGIDRIMTHMIYDNNILFQFISTGNKDDEKNSMYNQLIKNTLYNFLDKSRSVFGQEDDITAYKWTWFDTQMHITFQWTQVIAWT